MAYEKELDAAKKASSLAARLCQKVQKALLQSDVQSKSDKSPVTVADYGSQAVVSLLLQRELSSEPFSLVAEEDSADLRKDGSQDILERITKLVNDTLANEDPLKPIDSALSTEDLLRAIDCGTSEGGPNGRHWVLDPIDGTKGFLRGDQYAVALGLLEEGKVVLGVLACPNLPLASIAGDNNKDSSSSSSSEEKGCLFYATIGSGTYMQPLDSKTDPVKVHVSSVENPEDASFFESFEGAHSLHDLSSSIANKLGVKAPPVRGSKSLTHLISLKLYPPLVPLQEGDPSHKSKVSFFLVVICQKKKKKDMPGIRGPSEYSQEPSRDPCLKVNAKEPFNAEPPRSALVSSYVTPVHLFYKRNHGPIPIVDHIESYSVSVTGLIDNPTKLFIKDIRSLPKYNVTATLQCAGNRRTAMSKVRNVRGVGWDVSALGNAVWGGAKLADVLELLGIPKLTSSTVLGGRHVEFVSVDRCKEENGGPYKASIPLSQATNPDADVLLAYEMNGEILNRDHGFPLRVVVPGVIGARSVKWLDSINILAEECQGFFMQKDYKMFPPSVNWDNIDWSSRRPQMDFPVQSAICSLEDVQMVKPGKVSIKGYAVSGGGRGIERVDISMDGGKSWVEASRTQKPGEHYISEHNSSDKWAWVLFEATVDVSQSTEVIAKAVDSAANVQPENVESVWNLRGVLNTSWHRVLLRLGHSKL